jgi:hypothetical protein
MLGQATLLVRDNKEFKFQLQVDDFLEKGLQLGEDDLLCNLSTLETMDMFNLGVPFGIVHEIHLSILQHLIYQCS